MDTVKQNDGSNKPRLLPLASLLGELEADAARRNEARIRGVARGPVTGLKSLDDLLGDCLEPGLHVVHGGPGVGKTAFALQIAAQCGCPALFVTTEMRPVELLRRVIARSTGTFLNRLKSGEYDPATVMEKARQAVARVPLLALVDACDAYADPDYLHAAALGVRDAGGAGAYLLLVVDSIHSWSEAAGERDLSEYDRLGAALDALRSLAGRLNCPVLVVAERNRLSMKDGGLHAAAGTRAFEYSAETMLTLDVDKDAQAAPDERIITARIEKNRNGPAHSKGVKLVFTGALQRFTDPEPGR